MTQLACANPTCAARRHTTDCPGDPCRGCLPRLAADGLLLCTPHVGWLAEDARAAAELHGELVLALAGGSGQGEPVSGSRDRPTVNMAAVDMRREIRHTLVSWTTLICEQRGWQPPADDIRVIGRLVARNNEWLAARDFAGEVSVELADLARRARAVAHPSGVRTIPVAACPLQVIHDDGESAPCTGTVRARIRPADSLLPSALVCDVDDGHSWTPDQWRAFARAVRSAA